MTPLSPDDAALARESGRRLAAQLDAAANGHVPLRVADDADPVRVPTAALRLFVQVLGEMARGRPVAVAPAGLELTIPQAADLLLVSPAYFAAELDAGKLPARGVGDARRVRLDDLLTYEMEDTAERRRLLGELMAEAQELGLGY